MLIGSVVDDVALIDVAGAGELCTARTNVDVTFLVEEEVGSAAMQLCPRNELHREALALGDCNRRGADQSGGGALASASGAERYTHQAEDLCAQFRRPVPAHHGQLGRQVQRALDDT